MPIFQNKSVGFNSKMMTAEKFGSHCIFCTSECSSSFTIINGKPVKLKIENGTENKHFLASNFDPGAPDDSSIESHLRVIFILRKILNIEVTTFSKFLGKCEGQFHPGLWISLCSSCDQLLGEFWEKLKEIGRLERRLKSIKSELTGFVQDALAFKRNATGVDLVWNEIRKNAVAGTASVNSFDEESNIERVKVATLQSEDKFADDDEDGIFTESDGEEPLIKVELLDNNKLENLEERNDPTYNADSNLQKRRRRNKGSSEKFGCSKCSKLFDDEERLKAHFKNYHTILPCKSCDKTFTSLKLLKGHQERVHTQKGCFPCSTCSKVFTSPFNLYHHKKRNHDDTQEGFPCPICSWVFASRLKLWRHKRSTHEKKTYRCSDCVASFKTQSGLEYHVNTVHKPAPVPCPQCQTVFNHRSNLKRHLRLKHSNQGKGNLSPIEPKPCPTCGKSFSSGESVARHIRDVHGNKRFSCSECNVVVKSKQQLNVHMKAVHNPETHICQICGKSFGTTKYLNQHVTRYHATPVQKESWVKCPRCKKPFYQNYLLKCHLLRSSCRLGKIEETQAAAGLPDSWEPKVVHQKIKF